MSYTSTVASSKRALVDLLSGSVTWQSADVPIHYSWSPGTTDALAMFATRPVIDGDERIEVDVDYAAPVFQPDLPFNESHVIELTMWCFRPDLQPDELEMAEQQIDSLVGQTLALLAADTDLSATGVMWALPGRGGTHRVQAYEKGWAVFRVLPIAVTARLQP